MRVAINTRKVRNEIVSASEYDSNRIRPMTSSMAVICRNSRNLIALREEGSSLKVTSVMAYVSYWFGCQAKPTCGYTTGGQGAGYCKQSGNDIKCIAERYIV